jgi:hypothetical protein
MCSEARSPARFAIGSDGQLSRLVLVDALGLARFRPSPRFAFGLATFAARPSERRYDRFMRQCSYDLDSLRGRMGQEWEPFAAYNIELPRAPQAKAAGKLLRNLGIPRIPPRGACPDRASDDADLGVATTAPTASTSPRPRASVTPGRCS